MKNIPTHPTYSHVYIYNKQGRWYQNQMAAISQTTFSNGAPGMK